MRSELKYVLPNSALPSMRRAIEPFMDLDGHCRGREEEGYTVRSIYLDSPDLSSRAGTCKPHTWMDAAELRNG